MVSRVRGRLPLLLSLILAAGYGCSKPPARSTALRLQPGERYRFVEHVSSAHATGLTSGSDGLFRLPRWGGSQPVVAERIPRTLSARFLAPGPFVVETGIGVLPAGGSGRASGAVRFLVRAVRKEGTQTVFRRVLVNGSRWEEPAWLPVRASIAAKPGEEIEVQLVTERTGPPWRGAAVWVDPTVSAPARTPPPNLVLVVVDALRADHLGCYGYSRDTSPWIDSMASGGVEFREAVSNGTWTFPSMLSLLTSSYPLLTGYRQEVRGEGLEGVSAATRVLLPVSLQGELQGRGYVTLGSVGGGYIDASFGFSRGFDWYWSPRTDKPVFLDQQLGVLKRRLQAQRPEPFFLLLHTNEVHNYLQGWGHHLEDFDGKYRGRLRNKRRLFAAVTSGQAEGLSEADLQYLRDLYDGEIRHTDASLREFFAWLQSQPWGRNTVVVLTADHGESFGEHGLLHHGNRPYHEIAHVPLILHYPEGQHRGQVVRETVGLIDVMPTLLDLAGVKPPAEVVGQSLVPRLSEPSAGGPRALLSENAQPLLYVREGRWSYFTSLLAEHELLFDLQSDPTESRDVAATHPAEVARLRVALAREVLRAGQGYRLLAFGKRPEEVTVQLTAKGGFSYFLQVNGAGRGVRTEPPGGAGRKGEGSGPLSFTLPAGDAPQVVLFAPTEAKQPVDLEARMAGAPVPAARLFLGDGGQHPTRLPVRLEASGGGAAAALASATGKEWGIRVWSPPASRSGAPTTEPARGGVPVEVQKQLKSLGYTR